MMADRKTVLEWAKKIGLAIDSQFLEPRELDAYIQLCELAQAEERNICKQDCLNVLDERKSMGRTNGFNAIYDCLDRISKRDKK